LTDLVFATQFAKLILSLLPGHWVTVWPPGLSAKADMIALLTTTLIRTMASTGTRQPARWHFVSQMRYFLYLK
jgi:hypothetical protein